MSRKKEKEKTQEEKKPQKILNPCVTLLPPAQEGQEWVTELQREAAALIQRRLQ